MSGPIKFELLHLILRLRSKYSLVDQSGVYLQRFCNMWSLEALLPVAGAACDHPWITLNSFRGGFFSGEAQYRANWTEPGCGTRAYMNCNDSHSEGGAGDDEMVPCSPHRGRTGGREKRYYSLSVHIIEVLEGNLNFSP